MLLLVFFIAPLPLANAEWLLNGKPVKDCSYAKTKGGFGAIIILTDKPDELFEAWNKNKEDVSVDMGVEKIQQGESITACIIFSNCASDKKGMANVSVKFTLLGPNGNVVEESGNVEVWINKPAPPKRISELSVSFLRFDAVKKNSGGFYIVKALVYDRNSGIKIDLERQFQVI